MEIKAKIRLKMAEALREGRKEDKLVYSNALDNILKGEKNDRRDYNNADVIVVLQKIIKQCNETLEYAKQADNDAIIKKTENEIALLSAFCPKMLGEDDIKSTIYSVILEKDLSLHKKNKGALMKELSSLRGKADMKLVSKIVDEILVLD